MVDHCVLEKFFRAVGEESNQAFVYLMSLLRFPVLRNVSADRILINR